MRHGSIPRGHRKIAHRAAGRVVRKCPFKTIGCGGRQRLRIGVAIDGLFALAHPANAQARGGAAAGQEIARAGSPRTVGIAGEGHGDGADAAALARQIQRGAGRRHLDGDLGCIGRQLRQAKLRGRHHGGQEEVHLRASMGNGDRGFGAQNGLRQEGRLARRQRGGRKRRAIAESDRRRQAGKGHHAISAVGELKRQGVAGLFQSLARLALSAGVEGEHLDGIGGHDVFGRSRVDGHFVFRTALSRFVGQFDGAATHAQQQ